MVIDDQRRSLPDRETGLLVHNTVLKRLLALANGILPKSKKTDVSEARRVLICISGHLGDAILALYAVRAVEEALPSARIEILTSRWLKPVMCEYFESDRLHFVDYWSLNRAEIPLWKKMWRNAVDFVREARSLRSTCFDIVVDLYPFWPNAALVLAFCRIPMRVGYLSGGLGNVYTTRLPWKDEPKHTVDYHQSLIEKLPNSPRIRQTPLWNTENFKKVTIPSMSFAEGLYVVVHPGAGEGPKEWPLDRWINLIQQLTRRVIVVLTGRGAKEKAVCDAIVNATGAKTLCGRLSFHEYLALLSSAKLFVGVDSMGGHAAAALGIPGIVIFSGINRIEHWRPLGEKSEVVNVPVPCAPCHIGDGCKAMECMKDISVEVVFDRLMRFLVR